MEYKKIKNKYIIRIDKGEELIEKIREFCQKEKIKSGSVIGIGATNNVEIGLFETKSKKYHSKKFRKDFEITSLVGNISQMNNQVYLHLHINLCDKTYKCIGGHLNSAVISGTFEGIIEISNSKITRKFNPEVGLNLYKLDK